MRGFVPTPDAIVDSMVAQLFSTCPPSKDSTILDPGCGPGAFIEGIIRWCIKQRCEVPRITGIELDPERRASAAARFHGQRSVSIVERDFLTPSRERFDYVIGNPPYVSIYNFSEEEKAAFRAEYATASGRFDLYILFFEQALRLLKPGGRLVFITPEKFLYVKTAEPLRRILARLAVREVRLADEETFGDLITYPTITTIDHAEAGDPTTVMLRSRESVAIRFPRDGSSLLPFLNGHGADGDGLTLDDICLRVSCGVATGADGIFVQPMADLSDGLAMFAYPTISGRQLVPGKRHVESVDAMLVPYDENGALLPLARLGALAKYLAAPERKEQLTGRVCARAKPWHAFHDSVPLDEILRPKILCKDITEEPGFWIDRKGTLVPRHTVYYIVPKEPARIDELAAYLNSDEALGWMRANCQRAASNFLRLQSAVLKRLPVPDSLAPIVPKRLVLESPAARPRRGRARLAELVLSE